MLIRLPLLQLFQSGPQILHVIWPDRPLDNLLLLMYRFATTAFLVLVLRVILKETETISQLELQIP